jgi:hypothetical protein
MNHVDLLNHSDVYKAIKKFAINFIGVMLRVALSL